jgi:hypothetical protein
METFTSVFFESLVDRSFSGILCTESASEHYRKHDHPAGTHTGPRAHLGKA